MSGQRNSGEGWKVQEDDYICLNASKKRNEIEKKEGKKEECNFRNNGLCDARDFLCAACENVEYCRNENGCKVMRIIGYIIYEG